MTASPKPRLSEAEIVRLREMLAEQSRICRANPATVALRARLGDQMRKEDKDRQRKERRRPRPPKEEENP